jgi:hypothetical protein
MQNLHLPFGSVTITTKHWRQACDTLCADRSQTYLKILYKSYFCMLTIFNMVTLLNF